MNKKGRERLELIVCDSAVKIPINSNRLEEIFLMGLYSTAHATASPDPPAYVCRSSNKILPTSLNIHVPFYLYLAGFTGIDLISDNSLVKLFSNI